MCAHSMRIRVRLAITRGDGLAILSTIPPFSVGLLGGVFRTQVCVCMFQVHALLVRKYVSVYLTMHNQRIPCGSSGVHKCTLSFHQPQGMRRTMEAAQNAQDRAREAYESAKEHVRHYTGGEDESLSAEEMIRRM